MRGLETTKTQLVSALAHMNNHSQCSHGTDQVRNHTTSSSLSTVSRARRPSAPYTVTHGTLRAENKDSTHWAGVPAPSQPSSISAASTGRDSALASWTSEPASVPPVTA